MIKLLKKSPAHFHYEWPLGKEDDDENEKDHFRFGSLCHMALLQPELFRNSYVLEPVFEGPTKTGEMSTRSKIALSKKAAWYAKLKRGTLVVTEKDFDRITGAVHSILAHPQAAGIISECKAEISGWFRDPETGLKCRIRPDLFGVGATCFLTDFKTTRDASEYRFYADAWKLKYIVQIAFYYDGVYNITGRYPDITSFIAVEKDPPYVCCVYPLREQDLDLGRTWYKHAMATLKQCIELDRWPGYQSQSKDLILPEYAYRESLPLYDFGEEGI